MICENCGTNIHSVSILRFGRDGNDYEVDSPLIELDDEEDDSEAVFFETDQNWTGYDLSEEEQMEGILCPKCNKFPFKHKEVQIDEIVRVVCFKTREKRTMQ